MEVITTEKDSKELAYRRIKMLQDEEKRGPRY